MKKGFVVLETCTDYEQILCLEQGDHLPLAGLLTWPGEGFERHIFSVRSDARAAIERTHHYAKAFGFVNMPEKQYCKIVPVLLPVSP